MAKDEEFKKKSEDFKGKKGSKKGVKLFKKVEEPKSSKRCMNDPNWYVLHPELLRDVASLPFSHWLGDALPLRYTSTTTYAHEATIVKLVYTYTLGVACKANDPVNLAIRNLYTYVRHQNSGHSNYEPADLGMYLLSTGTLIASLVHIERCLGVIKYYQRRSRVVPKQLCDALGINLSNAAANLANLTARLNVLWQRVSSLCIPKDFKFIQRWIWMNSMIFKDHESDKAALIVFKPIGVPSFSATLSSRGGIIQQNTDESATPDLFNWFIDAEALADAILEDEDMNIMSGDILKAYGFENLMSFGMTSLDYQVEPIYVEEMLPQVQHVMTLDTYQQGSTIVTQNGLRTAINYDVAAIINDQTDSLYTICQDPDKFTIYQVDGVVICTPCQAGYSGSTATVDTTTGTLFWGNITDRRFNINNDQKLISSYNRQVAPEEVVLATRLMYTEKEDSRVTNTPVFFESCGTEVVSYVEISYAYKNSNGIIGKGSVTFGTDHVLRGSSVAGFIQPLQLLSQVDWAPFMYIHDEAGGTVVRNNYFFGDIDNFTAIYPETLVQMHTNAVLAEFNVTKYNLIK